MVREKFCPHCLSCRRTHGVYLFKRRKLTGKVVCSACNNEIDKFIYGEDKKKTNKWYFGTLYKKITGEDYPWRGVKRAI